MKVDVLEKTEEVKTEKDLINRSSNIIEKSNIIVVTRVGFG